MVTVRAVPRERSQVKKGGEFRFNRHILDIFVYGASPLLALCLLIVAADMGAYAQHVELGAFGNYVDLNIPGFPANALGIGGRASFKVHPLLQVEIESAYDIKHSQFTFVGSASSFSFINSKLGILHANGGLKLQTRGGSYFVFVKGGANWYDPERAITTVTGPPIIGLTTPTPLNTFIRSVLYPGAGVGFHAGPLGIRVDAGDEMTWDGGVHHSLRVTFGPTVRF